MTILLIKQPGANVDPVADTKSMQRAFDLYKQKEKNIEKPFIVTIDGYDLFAIPGTVEKITADIDGRIRLDITEIYSEIADE